MRRWGLLAALLLASCASQQGVGPETPGDYLAAHGLHAAPTPDRFSFCLDHACARSVATNLPAADWRQVVGPLERPTATPAAERAALAEAVARFERAVRGRLGLGPDLAGTYPGAFSADQNDCVDETANTMTLLLMLKRDGALAYHDVGPPARRGVFFDGALPHRSATLAERTGGARFVLDSWFRDSGVPADVAPLADWLNGWTPEGGAWS